jgi:hypothetical protein
MMEVIVGHGWVVAVMWLFLGYLTHTATAVVEWNSSVVVMRARIRMLK